ncbi:MAG: 50S ribosomal protein L22, partial [Myxococcota bacterium]
RGRSVEEALNVLTFSQKAAAEPVGKLLKSAVANADNRGGFDLDRLYVKTAFVDEGLTWKRWLPRAQGRATRIRKRTSHVTIELAERG